MSKMVEVYVRLCEQGKNFYTVPSELQNDVLIILTEHHYVVTEKGIVTRIADTV